MAVSRRDLLRWQFDLTWSLLEFASGATGGGGLPVGACDALLDSASGCLAVLDRHTEADLDLTARFPWQNNPDPCPYGRLGELRIDEEHRRDRATPVAPCRVRRMKRRHWWLNH